MSSDPKKPDFDAPPSGTPDLLQQDVPLDRRRRVPTFEELQRHRPPEAPTDPVTAATPRPAAPPSPVEFARARPLAMPQVTPTVPTLGAVMPEGQTTPARRGAQVVLEPAPSRPTPVVSELQLEPAPRSVPAGNTFERTFTPAQVPKPRELPPEMLVTQPGTLGPFTQLRGAPAPSISLKGAPNPTEGTTVIAEPASLWRRLGAWVADLGLVGALVLGFLTVAMAVIAPQNLTPLQQLMAVAAPGVALAGLLAFVYTTLFAFLWNGRTPGRRLMSIYLVDSTGQAPAPARALIRAVLSLVSFGLFLSGFWLALFDRHGQTLHDKVTRTFVVKL